MVVERGMSIRISLEKLRQEKVREFKHFLIVGRLMVMVDTLLVKWEMRFLRF